MAASMSDSPAEVVVAGHVCLDVIPVLPGPAKIEPGRLLEIGPAEMSTGGAVPNIGLSLHRLGVPVRLMGKVGDDLFGRAVLEALRARDPELARNMVVGAGETTSYSIVISPPGVDRCFLHCSGANDTFTADDVRYDELASARVFHFGYPPIMRSMYADGGSELRRMLARARDAGPAISLDMCRPDPDGDAGRVDWRQLLEETLPLVDVFVPSIEELLFMLDRDAYGRLDGGAAATDVVDLTSLSRLGDQLLGMGTAVVAIKLGEQGLYVRTSASPSRMRELCDRMSLDLDAWCDREVVSPCFRARRVAGTTGAGDCTIAGLLAALLRGEGPVQAATSATAVGASSVEAPDATSGVPPWPELDARVRAGWERHPIRLRLDDRALEPDALGTLSLSRPDKEPA
jgi:sugar/nucleoside kinase (ribokinase family)